MQTQQLAGTFTAADASPDVRAAFIRRTYQHLAMAILAFVALEVVLFKTGIAYSMASVMLGGSYSWLLVLGGFMVVSWVAEKWARAATSRGTQYLGLGLYIVAEAIIFVPLLVIAVSFSSPDTIPIAAVITGLLFLGLTVTAFTTRKDFSFLGGILKVGGCVALGISYAVFCLKKKKTARRFRTTSISREIVGATRVTALGDSAPSSSFRTTECSFSMR